MHAVRGKYTTQKNLRVTFISCSVTSIGHEWPWIELRLEMSRSAGTGAAPNSKHWFTTSFFCSSDASCSFVGGTCWLLLRLILSSSDVSCSFAGGACSGVSLFVHLMQAAAISLSAMTGHTITGRILDDLYLSPPRLDTSLRSGFLMTYISLRQDWTHHHGQDS